jgi:hypothetical protein
MTTISQAPPLAPRLVLATGPGFAEIKKHNRDGIGDGLLQLRTGVRQLHATGAPRRQPYLITYLPVDKDGVGSEKPDATHLRVFAIDFSAGIPPSTAGVLQRTWMSVGKIPIPRKARPFLSSARQAHRFGREVEGAVRHLFLSKVVNKTRRGGRKPSHDVIWDELAEFYSELARELTPPVGSFRF